MAAPDRRARVADDNPSGTPAGPATIAAPPDVIAEANATETVFPDAETLLHLPFLRRARQEPDRVAVIHAGGSLTYGELAGRAEALARVLRRNGVAAGQVVAIVMDKGWEQVVAAVGVLLAGAVFVPVDPGFPTERLHHLLDHSEAGCVVTQGAVDDRLDWPRGLPRVRVEVLEPVSSRGEIDGLAPAAPDDLAYIVYTSGSTGLPKGVMITHRGAVNTVLDMNSRFDLVPGDRVLAVSSFTFDLAVYDIFGTLAAGATIVMPVRTPIPDAAVWLGAIREHSVTVWNSAPALMEMLVELAEGRGDRGRMPTLRLALLGGDWIRLDLPNRIRALAPEALVVSTGGATEGSIWSILYPIGEVQPGWRSIPYGKPMANQTFHIRTEDGRACGIGEVGELYIGGIGVAAGYWRDPARTAASFVPDPATGRTLYRTGDLGRYLPDGNIEFLGRKDFQVKIQGFRVELGELEASLHQHPAVKEAVATAQPDAAGDRRLFAYATVRSDVSGLDLREFLRGKLPHYMVPDAVMVLDALPLTPSGKVDRGALPEASVPDTDPAHDQAEAGSPIEEVLLSLWEGALGHERLGVDVDFFAAGGNSLRALRLVAAVNAVLEVEVGIGQLFETPTVRSFSESFRQDPQTWRQVSKLADQLVHEQETPAADGPTASM
ncbi:amino acid adenylation domain-containing protein [Micromonospora sp. MMS20-R2-29]|uniref:Amino acid adenylation domain-containing protein n=2 Tax=Micromonospora humidisoli TaxID=2807622 RepID=A0ABS2JJG7_9ACTN|nr:amino acid adenylation domain-containing protein [Micromonospora humidisoli]